MRNIIRIILVAVTLLLAVPNVTFAASVSWTWANEANYTVNSNKDVYSPGEVMTFSTSMTAIYASFLFDFPAIWMTTPSQAGLVLSMAGLWGGKQQQLGGPILFGISRYVAVS